MKIHTGQSAQPTVSFSVSFLRPVALLCDFGRAQPRGSRLLYPTSFNSRSSAEATVAFTARWSSTISSSCVAAAAALPRSMLSRRIFNRRRWPVRSSLALSGLIFSKQTARLSMSGPRWPYTSSPISFKVLDLLRCQHPLQLILRTWAQGRKDRAPSTCMLWRYIPVFPQPIFPLRS